MSQFRNFIFTSMPCSTSCNIPSSANDDVTKVFGENALPDLSLFTYNCVRILNLESNVENKSLIEDLQSFVKIC